MKSKFTESILLIACLLLISSAKAETRFPIKKIGGVYVLPINICATVTVDFVIDSGAADVAIPVEIAEILVASEELSEEDVLGVQSYVSANGDVDHQLRITLFALNIKRADKGFYVVEAVPATISAQGTIPLLGQSFLSQIPKWSIDVLNSEFVIHDEGIPDDYHIGEGREDRTARYLFTVNERPHVLVSQGGLRNGDRVRFVWKWTPPDGHEEIVVQRSDQVLLVTSAGADQSREDRVHQSHYLSEALRMDLIRPGLYRVLIEVNDRVMVQLPLEVREP